MDVNVLSSSLNSEDSHFFNQFSLGLLVNSWGYGCFIFFFLYLGFCFSVEFVFGALGEFLAVGFHFFCIGRFVFQWVFGALGEVLAVGFSFVFCIAFFVLGILYFQWIYFWLLNFG
jgi:hypothetical protein